jgi:outer membrane lipoprotein-sorting protein/thiol-disulfide isomerase/thioredoxin
MRVLMALLSIAVAATPAIAQNASPPRSSAAPDALAILRQVTQKYADAKSLRLEATQETTHSEELIRGWSKMILSATVGPDNHYRYEGRGPSGTALLVSDGKTIWTYHRKENLFTEKLVGAEKPGRGFLLYGTAEEAAGVAKGLPHSVALLADRLNSADLLPEETVTVDGRPYRCIGIHYRTTDLKKRDVREPEEVQHESTDEGAYWIDEERMVIVKIERHMTSAMTRKGSAERVASQNEVVSVFTTVELNPSLPDSSFVFDPPAQAKLVDEFPSQKRYEMQQRALAAAEENANAELIEKPVPMVELKSEDGKVVSLSSYRGKPTLIHVWATWCGPCVAMLPELKKLNSDPSAHGVVLLSVDVADDSTAAAKLLKNENVSWQNLHDANDAMRSAFHAPSGVPWQVLIDSEGKLALYHFAKGIASLRAAIAALGPPYSSMASENAEKPH